MQHPHPTVRCRASVLNILSLCWHNGLFNRVETLTCLVKACHHYWTTRHSLMIQLRKTRASSLSHWLFTVTPSQEDDYFPLVCSLTAQQGSFGNHSDKYKYYLEMEPPIKPDYGRSILMALINSFYYWYTTCKSSALGGKTPGSVQVLQARISWLSVCKRGPCKTEGRRSGDSLLSESLPTF